MYICSQLLAFPHCHLGCCLLFGVTWLHIYAITDREALQHWAPQCPGSAWPRHSRKEQKSGLCRPPL